MSKRQKHDWPVLLQEFSDSGQTQAQFCAERHINAKYFSLRRAKLLRKKPQTFVKASIRSFPNNNKPPLLVLKFPHVELRFDASIDPVYISQLIKASS